MVKLDVNDYKILYYLDINSRQSLRIIGNKVRLPKSVVQYRIKRLEQKGIIKNFYTAIDFYKLGYINIGIHICYQYYTPEIEHNIIKHFQQNNQTWFIANIQGKYDLIVMFTVKNIHQFFSFWKNTLHKFRNNFQNAEISFYPRTYYFPKTYLSFQSNNLRNENNIIVDGSDISRIDNMDYKILMEIALHSRKPLTEIAKKYHVSSAMIANRIRNLEKQSIIKGYKINVDYAKLGLQLFNVQYTLKNYENIHKIINYVKNQPNLISVSEVIGNFDLSMNFHIKDFDTLHLIINDILIHFPDDIKNRITLSYPGIYKHNYMPKIQTKMI
jgi:DNA-binding Lrp family transcriptional regulator